MTFAILVFPQVEELDAIGPWEMAAMWHQVAGGPPCLIVAEQAGPVSCAKGLSLNPHASFDTCPPLDVLLVPGGQGTRSEMHNPRLVDFVARQARSCKAVLSVCTGSFILHAAGLLAGRRATTHWGALDTLRAMGGVDVVEERFVRDGNIWSSAGVSAGIDLTLAYIADAAGEAAAAKVQFASEYYPSARRYGTLHRTHPGAPAYLKDLPPAP